MKALSRYLAGAARPAEDTILILEGAKGGLDQAAGVIDRLSDGRARLVVAILGNGLADPGAVARRFPRAEMRLLPGLAARIAFATLAALRVRAVLVAGGPAPVGDAGRLLRGAVRRGVPVFELDQGRLRPRSALAEPLTAGAELDDMVAHLIRAAGYERLPRFSPDRLAARLAHLPLATLTGGYVTRHRDRDILAARLGNPRTLLCLGNGPSARDPRLGALDHDALFRVNHDWRAKGFLDRPDMVFAGVKRSMRKLGRCQIGVATERKAHALLACRLLEPWHGRLSYVVVEEIAASALPPVTGTRRPTTGAYMLACAVALAPTRLAIAGMDMFRHPEGAYGALPENGAIETNAYTPAHDYDTDAAFITACLAPYEGEIIVFSQALAEQLARVPGARYSLIDRSAPD